MIDDWNASVVAQEDRLQTNASPVLRGLSEEHTIGTMSSRERLVATFMMLLILLLSAGILIIASAKLGVANA